MQKTASISPNKTKKLKVEETRNTTICITINSTKLMGINGTTRHILGMGGTADVYESTMVACFAPTYMLAGLPCC